MKVIVTRTEIYRTIVEADTVDAVQNLINGESWDALEDLHAKLDKGYDSCVTECEPDTPIEFQSLWER